MDRNLVRDLPSLVGQTVTVGGWVQTLRNQKRMQFLVLRDHTGQVQIVHERTEPPTSVEIALNEVTDESVVRVKGVVVTNEQVRLNQLEILAEEIVVESRAQTPLPITAQTNLDQRLDWRFLDIRQPRNRLIFEVQTTVERAMREYWEKNGFLEIHSPKFMGSASESGAELFRVDYFGGNAYLAQSPQFYKQMAIAAGLDRIFEIGPVFRANPSFTSRHDTEFTSVDVEMGWIDSHEDVMAMEEAWLHHVITAVAVKHGGAIKSEFGVEGVVPTLPFPRLTMDEARQIVSSSGYTIPAESKGDLDPEAERIVSQYVSDNFGHEFIFVTDYPVSVRAFYHMRYPEKPETTKSFDLLWKGLEVTTGAQREHRYDRLVSQTFEKGIAPESLQYYLDFFKYGCPPHGGFGLGLTRVLMVLLGVKNVREVTYVYRGPKRLVP